jgi:hypothetical protein
MASSKNLHASKRVQKERMIAWYVEETGDVDIDMEKVARWAVTKGVPLPKPPTPIEMLAREFSRTAREVHGRDPKTGKEYRKYHAITEGSGTGQTTFWVDIDNPKTTYKKMHRSLMQRREQMIGDGLQLTRDADHWNSARPSEPIQIDLNLSDEVEWRKNAPDEGDDPRPS